MTWRATEFVRGEIRNSGFDELVRGGTATPGKLASIEIVTSAPNDLILRERGS